METDGVSLHENESGGVGFGSLSREQITLVYVVLAEVRQ